MINDWRENLNKETDITLLAHKSFNESICNKLSDIMKANRKNKEEISEDFPESLNIEIFNVIKN